MFKIMMYKQYFLRIINPATDEINLLELYNSLRLIAYSLSQIIIIRYLLF